jgi:hypothetical protein
VGRRLRADGDAAGGGGGRRTVFRLCAQPDSARIASAMETVAGACRADGKKVLSHGKQACEGAASIGDPAAVVKVPFTLADTVIMEERRTEVRMLCADMVDVGWQDEAGRTTNATGLLEDISPSGACLQVEMPVPPGVPIRWSSRGHEFSGNVRYCVYREIGYFVGVEFVADSKWSGRTYQPQHLLDLQKLLG